MNYLWGDKASLLGGMHRVVGELLELRGGSVLSDRLCNGIQGMLPVQ
jgi:hypothetical protein